MSASNTVHQLNDPQRTKELYALYDSLLSLKTPEECAAYLEDLCTVQELISLSQRLEIARRLCAGESFQKIAKDTGASTATISRVNKALNYGPGGYRTIIERLGDKS